MDNVYKFVVEDLEFDVSFYVREDVDDNDVEFTDIILRFNNKKYEIECGRYLCPLEGKTKEQQELFDNILYALENNKTSLKINKQLTDLVFTADLGMVNGTPKTYKASMSINYNIILKSKYDDLLQKYNMLAACHKCI